MGAGGGITHVEYEALLSFADAALRAETAVQWWEAGAALMLGPLLHADVVAFASIDHRGTASGTFGLIRPAWAEESVPTGSEMHRDLLSDHPLTYHLQSARATETVRVSDLVPARRWRRMAGFAKMKELIGATHQMNITVRADRESSVSTSPIRAHGDFTERELVVADQLRGLLQAADRHTAVLTDLRASRSASDLAVHDAAADQFGLTSRELVVLELVARGLTAAAAARTLRISVRTVSKHQENLYRKLGVQDRLTAVLLARRVGLLPEVVRPEAGPRLTSRSSSPPSR